MVRLVIYLCFNFCVRVYYPASLFGIHYFLPSRVQSIGDYSGSQRSHERQSLLRILSPGLHIYLQMALSGPLDFLCKRTPSARFEQLRRKITRDKRGLKLQLHESRQCYILEYHFQFNALQQQLYLQYAQFFVPVPLSSVYTTGV